MLRIDAYRVGPDRWRRSWEAEWTGCHRGVRGWTKRGVIRKAMRAAERDLLERASNWDL